MIPLRSSAVVHVSRSLRVVLVVAVLAALSVTAGPAAAIAPAQDTDAELDTTEFDANEAEGTVDSVRRRLIAIAIGTGVMLVLYIWHTDPRRRFEVATRRRERREAQERMGLEDGFVLPSEVDEGDLTDDGAGPD